MNLRFLTEFFNLFYHPRSATPLRLGDPYLWYHHDYDVERTDYSIRPEASLNETAFLRVQRSAPWRPPSGLLLLAFLRISPTAAGQSAIPISRPGQEDLTFWANHNGLEQIEAEGEVGFGDMAHSAAPPREHGKDSRAPGPVHVSHGLHGGARNADVLPR